MLFTSARLLLLLTILLSLLPCVPARGEDISFSALPEVQIPWRSAKDLEFETVGPPPGRPWAKPLATLEVAPGQWRHVFYFKKRGKSERVSYPAVLNLNTGAIKEYPEIPGLETWKTVNLKGRLYLGQNLPGHVVVYDPQTDAFTDLGHAFNESSTVFRMAVTADGMIALAGNHPAELSLLDPRTGVFTKYPKISEKNTYCYELGVDGDYLYGGTRGKGPWELFAIHRPTGEKTLVTTRPTDGYINLSGNLVSTREITAEPWTRYRISGTTLTPVTDEQLAAEAAAKPKVEAPAKPEVYHDSSTAYDEAGLYTLHYQQPGDLAWKTATLKVPLGSESLVEAISLSDGRIMGVAGAYVPAVLVDPRTGKGTQLPLPALSIRSALLQDHFIYFTGYPGAAIYKFDLTKPSTVRDALPNRPAVPDDAPNANPRMVTRFHMTNRSGGHIGVGLFPASDGRIFLCTRRHRHHRGFSIAWYNPADDSSGTVDTGTAFDHLQIGGISQTRDGRHLLISTYIEPNDQVEGTPPPAARLFVMELPSGKLVGNYTPVADSRSLTGIEEVAPGEAVGLAIPAANDATRTIVYRIRLSDGQVLKAVKYVGTIQGYPGVSSLPVKGASFILGPDGQVWTSVGVGAERSVIMRLDPRNLTMSPVGLDPTNGSSMLFHQGDLYLAGRATLRRVPQARALLAQQ